jgi:hypothetical protein
VPVALNSRFSFSARACEVVGMMLRQWQQKRQYCLCDNFSKLTRLRFPSPGFMLTQTHKSIQAISLVIRSSIRSRLFAVSLSVAHLLFARKITRTRRIHAYIEATSSIVISERFFY